jgi:hypothetical protein
MNDLKRYNKTPLMSRKGNSCVPDKQRGWIRKNESKKRDPA